MEKSSGLPTFHFVVPGFGVKFGVWRGLGYGIRIGRVRCAATPAERRLWRYVSRSALGAKFSRQMLVGPYFADFLCRELSLVVELDGYSHGLCLDYDVARDRWMAEQGYRVLRFPNEAVFLNMEGVLTVIRMEIEVLRSGSPRPARR
ncbi:MAG: DUF559 domain-containing protein [Novosphingobium sp.]